MLNMSGFGSAGNGLHTDIMWVMSSISVWAQYVECSTFMLCNSATQAIFVANPNKTIYYCQCIHVVVNVQITPQN